MGVVRGIQWVCHMMGVVREASGTQKVKTATNSTASRRLHRHSHDG